jgi:hypothetical protein
MSLTVPLISIFVLSILLHSIGSVATNILCRKSWKAVKTLHVVMGSSK